MPKLLKGALSTISRHWPSHSQLTLAHKPGSSLRPRQHSPGLSLEKKTLYSALRTHNKHK